MASPSPMSVDQDDDIDFNSMTKSELQVYADEHSIPGVNSAKQTKSEMIEAILNA